MSNSNRSRQNPRIVAERRGAKAEARKGRRLDNARVLAGLRTGRLDADNVGSSVRNVAVSDLFRHD